MKNGLFTIMWREKNVERKKAKVFFRKIGRSFQFKYCPELLIKFEKCIITYFDRFTVV